MSLGKIIDKKYNELSKRIDMQKVPEQMVSKLKEKFKQILLFGMEKLGMLNAQK